MSQCYRKWGDSDVSIAAAPMLGFVIACILFSILIDHPAYLVTMAVALFSVLNLFISRSKTKTVVLFLAVTGLMLVFVNTVFVSNPFSLGSLLFSLSMFLKMAVVVLSIEVLSIRVAQKELVELTSTLLPRLAIALMTLLMVFSRIRLKYGQLAATAVQRSGFDSLENREASCLGKLRKIRNLRRFVPFVRVVIWSALEEGLVVAEMLYLRGYDLKMSRPRTGEFTAQLKRHVLRSPEVTCLAALVIFVVLGAYFVQHERVKFYPEVHLHLSYTILAACIFVACSTIWILRPGCNAFLKGGS